MLADQVPPESIGFIAFTRKAAYEARDRACLKFKFTPDQLPWFKTMHSLAFQQLGLGKANVMQMDDYMKLANILGLYLSFKTISEDGTFNGMTKGDRLFFAENMARARMLPLKDYWEQNPDDDIYWYELQRVSETLRDYKRVNQKIDFTDIIYKFLEVGEAPELSMLIIDEAQDLTPLQWQMANKLAKNAAEVYIAGDDDQAIFRWAGADVDHFIKMPGKRIVLHQSYRVPSKIQEVAFQITNGIENRVAKEWKPRMEEGEVSHETSLDNIDMAEGSWLLLGRNIYILNQYVDHCLREGFVFDSMTGSPIRGDSFRAIKYWEELRAGKQLRMYEIANIYDHMTTRKGVHYGFKARIDRADQDMMVSIADLKKDFGLIVDTIWHEALDKLSHIEVQYFMAALRRGEKLLKTPRIKISTIHGVKGGEADNVVLFTDMADRTYREYQQSPEDEARVWYVGVTRARKRLFIMQPTTSRSYDI